MTRKMLIAGNWKMFKTTKEAIEFADDFTSKFNESEHEVVICSPFTQLMALKEKFAESEVKIGAQNMHFEEEGAYTGEISPSMLTEIGVDYCVIGHSERREYFAETDETVNKKLIKAFEHGINPIMCCGEVLEQRDAGQEFEVIEKQVTEGIKNLSPDQVEKLVIAYEPIWAIGTGRTATPEQAEEMCAFIRKTVENLYDSATAESIRIQYGGSVKPANATELLSKENIDGALIGGASLVPDDLIAIINY